MDSAQRPSHLGPAYASQFSDQSIVQAYGYRPPYPAQIFDILLGLIQDGPRNVLDLGCGRGEIAREIVHAVDRLDAVDPSSAMIAAGKGLPGGDHPRLRWICAKAEEASLHPPYALAAAGNSLHWMEWTVLFPRLAEALSPGARLAIVGVGTGENPWDAELRSEIRTFSTNKDFRPYNLIHELTDRRLFVVEGEREVDPLPYDRPIGDYIESIHSQNGFSRERMDAADAREFDARVRTLVEPYADGGMLHLAAIGQVIWGKPLA